MYFNRNSLVCYQQTKERGIHRTLQPISVIQTEEPDLCRAYVYHTYIIRRYHAHGVSFV
jgi:hypothetical protein